MKAGDTLHYSFVDLCKAFDTIPHETLWQVLEERGLSSLTLSAIKATHAKVKACVLTQEGLTESFGCSVGVKQGCPVTVWAVH